VSSVNWNSRSLEDLKGLVDDIKPGMLDDAITHFDKSAQHLTKVQDSFMAHMNSLGDAWQGKAASAAIDNAQSTYASMDDTRSTASSASMETGAYQLGMQGRRDQAKAVPNVDTSWGHAFTTGGVAGPIGVGAAKLAQDKKYKQNQSQVAQIVTQMDNDGSAHAETMKSTPWLEQNSRAASPPDRLPPVPGASSAKPGSSTPPSGGYNGGGGGNTGTGGYTPPAVPGPVTNPGDHGVLNGPKGHHPAGGTITTPQGGTSPTPNFPTIPQGGGTAPGTPGGVPGGPVVASPPMTTSPGGAGAAAAVLGGAGLLGAGAAGGRGLLAGAGGRGGGVAGEPEGRLGAKGGAGLGEGEGGLRGGAASGGAGVGEGEGGLRGGAGSGGIGEGDGVLRGGARAVNGVPADEQLGAGRSSMLRGAGSGGFAGEPVAGEAGRMGGYPMGGSGGRRRNDDEEAPMPDYLVETDEVWGDGASAAPPVIGE
jgi:uncharacterized protein YukE